MSYTHPRMFSIKVIYHFMNLFLSLPNDIKSYIYSFVKTHYANSIIFAWKRYISHKLFILYSIHSLPKFVSLFDYDLVYSVDQINTYFYFKKLYYLTTGYEYYIYDIYRYFYLLAVSLDDYEWINGNDNFYYSYNKFYCISISLKFKWNDILQLLN